MNLPLLAAGAITHDECSMTKKYFLMSLVIANLFFENANADALNNLMRQEPILYQLYADSRHYSDQLSSYARRQGFRGQYENLGTVIHEMIHIASARHYGYFIQGVYYEPYLRSDAWPRLRNRDITALLYPGEDSVISTHYLRDTPDNTMANILDEINSYSHVSGFICRNEPQSAKKQVSNLNGHLSLLGAYLRAARMRLPAEYHKLLFTRESAGVIETLYTRSVQALIACSAAPPRGSDLEIKYFLDRYRKLHLH